MKRFNFDRYQEEQLMAEGVAVHADTLLEATALAEDLARRTYGGCWRLQFTDNNPCPPYFKRTDIPHRCNVCYPLA